MLNNPYVPGDPYSYDLKWLVAKVKEILAQLGTLDEAIEAKIFEGFLEHSVVQFKTVPEMLAADITDGSIVLTLGYHEAGDKGGLFYLVKDFNPDQCSLDYFLTLDNNKQIAIPVIVTPYVTPEMFGAYGDDTNDDKEAFDKALTYQVPVVAGNKTYYLGSSLTIPYSTGLFGAGQESTILHFIAGAGIIIQGRNAEVANMYLKGGASGNGIDFASSHASLANIHDLTINGFTNGINADDYIWSSTFKNIRVTDCTMGLRASNGGFSINFTNLLIFNCDKAFTITGMKAVFDSCNFGMRSACPSCEVAGASSRVFFKNCNFEHDIVASATGAISLKTGYIKFEGGQIIRWMPSGTKLFDLPGSNYTGVIFDHVSMIAKSGDAITQYDLIPALTTGNNYGVFHFLGLSLDTVYGQTALQRWNRPLLKVDDYPLRASNPTGMDPNYTPVGVPFFLMDTNTMCYYNGTNVVDFAGNILS